MGNPISNVSKGPQEQKKSKGPVKPGQNPQPKSQCACGAMPQSPVSK